MSSTGKRVVLIDDDADIQFSVRAILKRAGYELDCYTTSQDGLDAMRQAPPDVLLLDIMLLTPSEGFHVAYEMKQDDLLRKIPIVMISSIGERMGMNYARELGTEYVPAAAFIEKPVSSETLLRTLQHVLGESSRA